MNRHLKVTIQRALLRYLNKAQPFWAHTSLESQLHSLPCGLYLGEWTLERNYSHSIIEVFKQSPVTFSPYLPRTSVPLSPPWVLPWRMDTRRYLFTQHYWGIQQSPGTFSLQLLRKSVSLHVGFYHMGGRSSGSINFSLLIIRGISTKPRHTSLQSGL